MTDDTDTFAVSEAVQKLREDEARRWQRFLHRDDPHDRAEQLALFLDFENLVIGASGSLPSRDESIPDKALTWLCRAYGPTTIRRAYADWTDTRFGRYQNALEHNGIDLTWVFRASDVDRVLKYAKVPVL